MKIAKKLKKNNVAVDVVSFGAEDENQVRRKGGLFARFHEG